VIVNHSFASRIRWTGIGNAFLSRRTTCCSGGLKKNSDYSYRRNFGTTFSSKTTMLWFSGRIQPFWCNTRSCQTDGRTDNIVRAMRNIVRWKKCLGANLISSYNLERFLFRTRNDRNRKEIQCFKAHIQFLGTCIHTYVLRT